MFYRQNTALTARYLRCSFLEHFYNCPPPKRVEQSLDRFPSGFVFLSSFRSYPVADLEARKNKLNYNLKFKITEQRPHWWSLYSLDLFNQ